MEIRRFESTDGEALKAFSSRLPDEDRNFFKEDVLEPGTLERWIADEHARRLVAVDEYQIVAYAGVLPLTGWSRHVAEIRIIVEPARRRRGLGQALGRAALKEAWQLECRKIVVEVAAEQESTIAMFQMLGFEPEALLREHARDRSGELRDLLVLAHHVNDNWDAMETLGYAETFGA
jgi:RimJ/RimL family protein N-acetyltransferase